MTCPLPDELLALYVEGDLPQTEASRVERHLRTCALCTDTADALRDSVTAIRQLRAYGVGPRDVSDVRRRVLHATAMESPGWALRLERALVAGFRRRYAVAGLTAAALVCAAGGMAIWHVRDGQSGLDGGAATQPVVTASGPPTVAVEAAGQTPKATPAASGPRPRSPVQRAARVQRPAREPQEMLVKLFTDDPNVIVYWLVEQNGAVR